MVDNKKDLVSSMTSQHRKLQADLGAVLAIAQSNQDNRGEQIVAASKTFQVDLTEHLAIEDGTFYPDYLAIIERNGGDAGPVKQFIEEMKKIGDAVGQFFGKYSDPRVIDSSIESYTRDLKSIIDTLNMRIETEEDSIYSVYLLME